MEINKIKSSIEAILFASGEPVSVDRLSQTLEIDRNTVLKIATLFAEELNGREGGLKIVRLDDSFQMTARPEFAPQIKQVLDIRRNTPLSQAAMEVLSIVAYHQPVTRGFVEQVRGVDSSGIMSNLVGKGLIEETGRLDVPGRPLLYGTTLDFLRCFGLGSLSDLPPVQNGGESEEDGNENAG